MSAEKVPCQICYSISIVTEINMHKERTTINNAHLCLRHIGQEECATIEKRSNASNVEQGQPRSADFGECGPKSPRKPPERMQNPRNDRETASKTIKSTFLSIIDKMPDVLQARIANGN